MTDRADIVVLRPEPGSAATAASAAALGLRAVAAPLFRIEPVAWTPPDGDAFDALVLGSANALRHAGLGLAALPGLLPVYAVGASTAAAARDAGLTVRTVGRGGIDGLVPALEADGRRRVLRLAGEDHVPLSVPEGIEVRTLVVYAARPLPLGEAAIAGLARGAIALLHSAQAALRFAEECARLDLPRSTLRLACLGQRIAAAAGPGWRECRAAATPDDGALLALAREMCQTVAIGVTASQTR